MDGDSEEDRIQKVGWTDWINQSWLKLPLLAMQDVGPAVQTLGAVLRITKRETYVPFSDISTEARLPISTVKKHIATLHAHGWVENDGRQYTRTGVLRRTATIKITRKTIAAITDGRYSALPWWSCCAIKRAGKLPWSAKAVLALVVSRLMMLNKAVQDQDGHGADADDLEGSILNFGSDERFNFSLAYLQGQTGLSRDSAINGKRWLHRHKIILCQEQKAEDGGLESDLLVPNWDFRVVLTPASPGRIFLHFEG